MRGAGVTKVRSHPSPVVLSDPPIIMSDPPVILSVAKDLIARSSKVHSYQAAMRSFANGACSASALLRTTEKYFGMTILPNRP